MARLVSTIHNVPFVLTMFLALIILKSAVRMMNTSVTAILQLALFGVATALLTLVFAPVPVAIRGREVGLASLAFLLILWLLFGLDAAYVKSSVFPDGCGLNAGRVQSHCQEIRSVMVFCLLTWIILCAYCCTLLIGTMRKNPGISRSVNIPRAAPQQTAKGSSSSVAQTTALRR